MPSGLIRILDRDLAVAGIAKVDDGGRTVDVHAFWHTFATHLVAAGVAPRPAQADLQHSSLSPGLWRPCLAPSNRRQRGHRTGRPHHIRLYQCLY